MMKGYPVMIACVTTETVKVSEPVRHFMPREVHLFRYVRNPGTVRARFYEDYFNEVMRQIEEISPDVLVVEHLDEPVYDLSRMFRSLETLNAVILKEHPDAVVHINMSCGPREFTSAAHILASMNPNVLAYTVSTDEYMVPEEDYPDVFYEGGRPVGLSKSVHAPKIVECIHVEKPDEVLVRSIRIFSSMMDRGVEPSARVMISSLKKHGLWNHRFYRDGGKTSIEQKERANYERNYKKSWKILGWIRNDGSGRSYCLTDQGRTVIEIFYNDGGHFSESNVGELQNDQLES